MLEGWLAAGADPTQVTVIRPSGTEAAGGVRVLTSAPEDEVPALLLLGVKPQKLDEVAPVYARACDPFTVLISILAGTPQAALHERFPTCDTIVRAMPNTPVRLRKGVIGLYSDSADVRALGRIERLMGALGTVEWFDDEGMFDAVTALAGSGPAFLFRFIDALAAAGEAEGLSSDQALRLAVATIEGAAALAADASESPAALAEKVASPGGSTRKGLEVLDADDRLKTLMRETLEAAVKRNRELGKTPSAR